MERRISMRPSGRAMIFLACLCLAPATCLADRSVVLVTGDSCSITDISMLDIRKAYLGVTVSIGGQRIRPYRITSDAMLDQIFYQSVVAMSKKSYDRRLLSLALKFGTPRPAEFSNLDEVAAALQRAECGIIYLWQSDAEQFAGVRTIKLLWQGE